MSLQQMSFLITSKCFQILGFYYAPELLLDYEACCSGGFWIIFNHLGIFNMHQNLNTRAFSSCLNHKNGQDWNHVNSILHL